MEIKTIKGNIFNSKTQTIVNTVNCVGVMGKGIALVYRLRYPKMYHIYKSLCSNGAINIGKLWIYKGEKSAPWVLNFPTKYHWKYPSKLEYIEKGLEKFCSTYKDQGITSISFPLLGTHNGGLDPEFVKGLMMKYLTHCDIPIEIYTYDPSATDDIFEDFKRKFINMDYEEIKRKTKLRHDKYQLIISCLKNSDVKSMISLIDQDGLGFGTMQKCFDLLRNDSSEKQLNLFS